MGKLRITKRTRSLLTIGFAFVVPGLGHMFNGQHARGLLLLAGLLLDYAAIFRLADTDGGRHLLLIVYLGLMLPVFYFISVFDALQSIERREAGGTAPRLLHGLLLTAAGLAMMALIKPPAALLPWMNELAELSVGPLLMIVSIVLIIPIQRRSTVMFKLGRMTAAVLILAVGTLLIWDQLQSRNDIALLREWWPILFVLIGVEFILYSTVLRHKPGRLRFDVPGTAAALVIAVSAFAVTQYADFPVKWLNQFNVDLNGRYDHGEERGFRYDKNIVKLPFDEQISSMKIANTNGDIAIRSADVEEIELYVTVWVDIADETEADSIAADSLVQVTPGVEVVIEGKGKTFGTNGNRTPKMNLEILIPRVYEIIEEDEEVEGEGGVGMDTPDDEGMPESGQPLAYEAEPDSVTIEEQTGNEADGEIVDDSERGAEHSTDAGVEENTEFGEGVEADQGEPSPDLSDEDEQRIDVARYSHSFTMDIAVDNGSLDVSGLIVQNGLGVKSGSGLVTISDTIGPVVVQGNNGGIEVSGIIGDCSLETKNGAVIAESITSGGLYAFTLNGDMELRHIEGGVDAETKNGKITIQSAWSDVKANTLNGNIEVSSEAVGGNWDLVSSVGEIMLSLPEDGDYSIFGSVTFGKIITDLPFQQNRKTIRGSVGAGTYRIHINATNSITIH